MGRVKQKKVKRQPLNVEFSPELLEEADAWYSAQMPVKGGKFPRLANNPDLKSMDDVFSLMASQFPKESYEAEKVAMKMIDVITDASKKFKHLSVEQSCYWTYLADYVNFYISSLQDQLYPQN